MGIYQIRSLMVEGGQRVISSFLAHEPPVVQCVIITIAPCIVGSDGVGVTSADTEVRVLLLGFFDFPPLSIPGLC